MLVLLTALATGALAGAMSLPHCVAMCGPYAAFACAARSDGREAAPAIPQYLLARSLGYVAIGAASGASGGIALRWLPPAWASLALAVTLASGMVLLAWRLLRGAGPVTRAVGSGLVPLRPRKGAPTTKPREVSRVEMMAAALARRASASPRFLGAVMALFPCGALYAALLVAAGTGSAWTGAASMLGFSITSALALGVSGWVARASLLLDRHTRIALGVALLAGALVLVARPLVALDAPAGDAACHAESEGP